MRSCARRPPGFGFGAGTGAGAGADVPLRRGSRVVWRDTRFLQIPGPCVLLECVPETTLCLDSHDLCAAQYSDRRSHWQCGANGSEGVVSHPGEPDCVTLRLQPRSGRITTGATPAPTRAAGSAMPAATPAARRPLSIRPDRRQSWQPSTEGSIGAIGRCWGRPAAGFGAHDVPMPLISVRPSAGGQRETVLARRMRALTAAARRPYLRALRTTRRATSRCHCPTPFPESISTFATSSAAVIFETTGCGTSRDAWSIPRPTPSPTATGVRSHAGEPVHEMWLRLTIDDSMRIHEVEAVTDYGPFGMCPAITDNFKRLEGLTIGPRISARGACKSRRHGRDALTSSSLSIPSRPRRFRR